jgi:hypothetical protein
MALEVGVWYEFELVMPVGVLGDVIGWWLLEWTQGSNWWREVRSTRLLLQH